MAQGGIQKKHAPVFAVRLFGFGLVMLQCKEKLKESIVLCLT